MSAERAWLQREVEDRITVARALYERSRWYLWKYRDRREKLRSRGYSEEAISMTLAPGAARLLLHEAAEVRTDGQVLLNDLARLDGLPSPYPHLEVRW